MLNERENVLIGPWDEVVRKVKRGVKKEMLSYMWPETEEFDAGKSSRKRFSSCSFLQRFDPIVDLVHDHYRGSLPQEY